MSLNSSVMLGSVLKLSIYGIDTDENDESESIAKIPPEIILLFFSHLPLRDLARTSLVSKAWRVLAVDELCKRGKDKWNLINALICQGLPSSAFLVANTLPYNDTVYMNMFQQADNQNNFVLSLKIACYKECNLQTIKRMAHCYRRHEAVNKPVMERWIQDLNLGNPHIVMMAKHLIAAIAANYVWEGRFELCCHFFKYAMSKSSSLIGVVQWQEIRKTLGQRGLLFPLLSLEAVAPTSLSYDLGELADCYCSLPNGTAAMDDWMCQTKEDPIFVLDLVLRLALRLASLNKPKQARSIVYQLLNTKYLAKSQHPIKEITDSIFWEIVKPNIAPSQVVSAFFIEKLIELKAWDEARQVAASSSLSSDLLDQINVSQAMCSSIGDLEAEAQQHEMQAYYLQLQANRQGGTQNRLTLADYPDDEDIDAEFFNFLERQESPVQQDSPVDQENPAS